MIISKIFYDINRVLSTTSIENGLGYNYFMVITGYSIKLYDVKWDPLYVLIILIYLPNCIFVKVLIYSSIL